MLSSQKKLKSGEVRDKVDIIVDFDGRICSYKSLSGGQKRRVDISLMLALDDVIQKSFNSKKKLFLLYLTSFFLGLDVVPVGATI